MGSPSHPGPPLAPAVVRPKDTRLPSRRWIKMESRRNRRSRSHGAGRPIGELRYRSDDVGGATHKSTSWLVWLKDMMAVSRSGDLF